ncbi:hypothetical protein DEO72_LG8g1857 [Vigna unguiculata]|uniref:Uncharacterized protein n=1 Tax=Vigna unguiculata TaxID=3917 RepID=A0A4D6MRX2_VIGUN|nr:hypothetical protein DEO72_LG8g1857 [Vigna unguiculata]
MEDVFAARFTVVAVWTTQSMHPSGSGVLMVADQRSANGGGFALHHKILVSLTVKESNKGWFVRGRDARRLEAVQNGGSGGDSKANANSDGSMMMEEEEGATTFVFANAGEHETSEKMVAQVARKWSSGVHLGQRRKHCGAGEKGRTDGSATRYEGGHFFPMEDVFAARFTVVAVWTTQSMHPSGSGVLMVADQRSANGGGFALHHKILVSLTVKESNKGWFVRGRDARRLEAVQNGGSGGDSKANANSDGSMMMEEEEGATTFVFANADVREDGGAGGAQMEQRRSSWTATKTLWCGREGSNGWQRDKVAVFRREQRWPDVVLAAKGDAGSERVIVREKEITVRVLVV